MLIEAIRKPIRLRWPTGEVRLEPGKPLDLPEDQARRLVEKAPERVRIVKPDLHTWRELAALSVGITQTDPRYRPMLDAMTACDEAYRRNDWPTFWRVAERAKAVAGHNRTAV